MLVITKNDYNRLVVTVSQNKTLPSPYYLFSLEHIQSKEKYRFIATLDASNTRTRYDEFWIKDSDTEPEELIAPIPTIDFKYKGQYWYSIYETSTLNLDPMFSTTKLEEGRCIVVDEVETNYVSYTSDNEDNSQFIYIP